MYKKVTKRTNFSLMALLVVLVLSVPTFGALTAYNNYNDFTSPWTQSLDPGLTYIELVNPGGEHGSAPRSCG